MTNFILESLEYCHHYDSLIYLKYFLYSLFDNFKEIHFDILSNKNYKIL